MLATGSFAHYARVLRESYMKGIPQLSLAHAGSEAIMGLNLGIILFLNYMGKTLILFLMCAFLGMLKNLYCKFLTFRSCSKYFLKFPCRTSA